MNLTQKQKLEQIKNHKNLLLGKNTESELSEIFNSEACQKILSEYAGIRDRIYTTTKTVLTFIKQALHQDKSCRNAVSGVCAEKILANKEVSCKTGAYCKARKKLSENAVHELSNEVAKGASKIAPIQWRPLHQREIKIADGSTLTAADTEENQKAFPQHKNQKKGCGFPLLRIVVVTSLVTGLVCDYSIAAYKGKGTGEFALLRNIFSCIEKDDILLGDRYFPSFFVMSDLITAEADGIFRGHHQRHYDFRTGDRLGKKEHVLWWNKPTRPEWMDKKIYDSYPKKIQIREFKVNGNVYVTTLLDPKKYPKKELVGIYERRWDIEINLRHIKSTMSMDFLTCKTPDMVKKEIGIHLLAYNCIRMIMLEACKKHEATPWKISFKGSLQLINQWLPILLNADLNESKRLYEKLLELIVKNKVGNRPGRIEPRVIKKRGQGYSRLSRPRADEKSRLKKKIEKRMSKDAAA